MKNPLKNINFWSLLMGGAADNAFMRLFKTLMASRGDVAKEHLKKAIRSTSKSDLLKVLAQLDAEDQEKIAFHMKVAKQDNREKEFSLMLAAALPRKEDGELIVNETKDTLERLAQADPNVMREILESLSHSSIWHQIGHELESIIQTFGKTLIEAMFLIGAANRYAKEYGEKISRSVETLRGLMADETGPPRERSVFGQILLGSRFGTDHIHGRTPDNLSEFEQLILSAGPQNRWTRALFRRIR